MNLKIRLSDQVVGLFILVAILGLAAALILLGMNQRWFSRNYQFHSEFQSSSGLNIGQSITLRGFEIGKVQSFSLNPDSRVVNVQFFIFDSYYESVVLENSVLELASSPIGLGTSLLFHPGKTQDPPKPPLAEGSFIPSTDFKEGMVLIREGLVERTGSQDTIGTILSQLGPIVEKVNNILFSLDEIVLVVDNALKGDRTSQLGSLLYSTDSLLVDVNDILTGRDRGPVGNILKNVSSTTDTLESAINTTSKELTVLLRDLREITSDPTGLVTKLVDPQGSLKTLLDDDNRLFDKVEAMLGDVKNIISEVEKFSEFLTGTTPQITGILEEGRDALKQGQDVLTALKNNPLLRGGVPEEKDQPTTFNSYRDEDF